MTIYSIFQFRNQGGRLAFFQFYLFVYLVVLGLHCWVGFSLVVVSGGYSLVSVTSLVADHGLCMHGLQQLWCTGLVVSQHVGSSRIRDRNRVSFIGRWILYHWAPGEAPILVFFFFFNCCHLFPSLVFFFLRVYWTCCNIASVLCFYFWLRGMWDLSSLTRDRTHTPCIERQSLNHWVKAPLNLGESHNPS